MGEVNKKKIEEFITIAKYDSIVYFIVFIISTLFILFIAHKTDTGIYLLFILCQLLFFVGKITSYINIKKIEQYISKNNLYDKMGEIKFWNKEYYILSDNYVIIKDKKITHFEYNKIKKIKKLKKHHKGSYDIYLNITLQNKEEYKILIYTTSLVNEEYKDISEFLLEKIDKL